MTDEDVLSITPLRCQACGRDLSSVEQIDESKSIVCDSRSCGVSHLLETDGTLTLQTFQLDSHYSLCVLPFSLDEAKHRADPFLPLENSPRWRRKTFDAANADDFDRTDYFLPYVRRFLFPTLYTQDERVTTTEELDTCRHYEFPLELLEEDASSSVHYQLHCYDELKDLDQTYAIELDRVQLIQFGYRVGFLVLRFRCSSPTATLFEQMRGLNYLRFVTELFRGFSMPLLATPTQSYRMPQLIGWLLEEFRGAGVTVANRPGDLTPSPTLPVQLFYDDRMLVYSFSCVKQDTVLEDDERNEALLRRALVVRLHDDEQVLGKTRAAELARISWCTQRWDSYSKDGGGLVVFDTNEFHKNFIGRYWQTYYFDIFLLAALQRVNLLALFERMADIGNLTDGGTHGRKQLRRIRYDVLLFKNQCWFSQITNRELGLNLWRQWQQVFEVKTLLTEVNEQSEQLDNYLRNRLREQNERLIRLGTVVTTAAPVIWSLDVLLGDRPWVRPVKWTLLTLLFTGAGLAAAYILRQQKRGL